MDLWNWFSSWFSEDNNNNIDYDLGGESGGFYAPGTTAEDIRTQNIDGNETFDFGYDNQSFFYYDDSADSNDGRSLAGQGKDALFGESGLNLTDKTIENISRFALGAQGFTEKQSRQGGQGRASRRSRSGSLSGPVGRGGSGAFKASQTSSQLIANMIAQSQTASNAANALSDRAYREAARELNMAIVQAISGEGKAAGPNITGKAPTISITSKVT
jgi:hypothetical protein